MSEFSFPNPPHRKRSCLFVPGEQILDQIETICSLRQTRERYQNVFNLFPKRYWNVCPFVFDITTWRSHVSRAAASVGTAAGQNPPAADQGETVSGGGKYRKRTAGGLKPLVTQKIHTKNRFYG
jgi:hypothetical protein